MKNLRYIVVIVSALFLGSCWEDEQFPGGGEAAPASLQINVTDAVSASPVSGATVQLYHTSQGYITETDAAVVKTTDDQGNVVFTKDELGEPGAKYFNVISGDKRNWSSVSSTPAMNLTSGVTRIKTKVADVHPSFIALTANDWLWDNYTNGDAAPDCNNDDIFRFLKTGRVVRMDAGIACDPKREAVAAGTDWSPWTLNADASEITMRDPDPWYFNNGYTTQSSSNTYAADFSIVNGTSVTVAFGADYVWTLVPAP